MDFNIHAHDITLMLTLFLLLISFIGGYAVLRKRVKDLEDHDDEKMDVEDHEKICKIASLEMKNHVSESMKQTLDDWKVDVFQPAIEQILKAINGG